MTSANQISIEKLHEDIHQALRIWHKERSDESPLDYLGLFHQFRRQGYSIREATKQVILKGLKHLQKDNPEQADLLIDRFINGKQMGQLYSKFRESRSQLYNMQKRAIRHLAQKLLHLEVTGMTARYSVLDTRLSPPTTLHLIGIDEHIKHLKQVVVSPEGPLVVSLSGMGGIGKTTLADTLLRQLISQGLFDDFGWVSARQSVFNLGGAIKAIDNPALSVEALVEGLVQQLLGFTPAQLSGEQAVAALQSRLKGRSHLIVIDNLETVLDIESLLPTLRRLANPSKFLLTSRESLYAEADVYHFIVPPLSEANALRLVREEAAVRNLPHLAESSDKELKPIYEAVGGNPLALRLIVGQTHIHHLDAVLSDLKAARGHKAESLYTYIYRRAWDNLDEVTRIAFLCMPLVIAKGDNIGYLEAASGLELSQIRRALDLLVTLNLVDVRRAADEWSYSIHNLTRTFLQEQVVKWQ